jgi:hypothetical protein
MHSAHHLLGPWLGSRRLPVAATCLPAPTRASALGTSISREAAASGNQRRHRTPGRRKENGLDHTLAALPHSSAASTSLPTSRPPARPQSPDLLICSPPACTVTRRWRPDLLAAGLPICLPQASTESSPAMCYQPEQRLLAPLVHPHLDLLFYMLLITNKICSGQTLHFTLCSSVCYGLQFIFTSFGLVGSTRERFLWLAAEMRRMLWDVKGWLI